MGRSIFLCDSNIHDTINLKLNDGRVVVASRDLLIHQSSYFKVRLADELATTGQNKNLELYGDDEQALILVLYCIHECWDQERWDDIPNTVSLDRLYHMALTCEKYGLARVMTPVVEHFIDQILESSQLAYANKLHLSARTRYNPISVWNGDEDVLCDIRLYVIGRIFKFREICESFLHGLILFSSCKEEYPLYLFGQEVGYMLEENVCLYILDSRDDIKNRLLDIISQFRNNLAEATKSTRYRTCASAKGVAIGTSLRETEIVDFWKDPADRFTPSIFKIKNELLKCVPKDCGIEHSNYRGKGKTCWRKDCTTERTSLKQDIFRLTNDLSAT
jgi:hypothetical protein